jgi:hypothetical protein
MKIGVVYGVHGPDEPFSLEAGRSLQKHPIEGVSAMLANEAAVLAGGETRYIEENMAFAFTQADETSSIYERRRAAKVLDWCRRGAFDIIIDIHETRDPKSMYSSLAINSRPEMTRAARFLGAPALMIEEYGIVSQMSNAVLMEYCTAGGAPGSVLRELRGDLRDLAAYPDMATFTDDFTPMGALKVWMQGGGIPVQDDNPEEIVMATGLLEKGAFAAITKDNLDLLGIARLPAIAHAVSFGMEHVPKGWLGDYVYNLGTTGTDWQQAYHHIKEQQMLTGAAA